MLTFLESNAEVTGFFEIFEKSRSNQYSSENISEIWVFYSKSAFGDFFLISLWDFCTFLLSTYVTELLPPRKMAAMYFRVSKLRPMLFSYLLSV